MEAKAVDRGHLCFLRLNAREPFREQDERILMVGIHVLHDVALVLDQWIGLCLGVIWGRHPSHHSEAAHVINVQYIHSVKEEIVKIDPVLAVWVTRQIEGTCGCQIRLGYSDDVPYQRDSGRTERFAAGVGLCHKKTGTWGRLQILRVHGHCADQEKRTALTVPRMA